MVEFIRERVGGCNCQCPCGASGLPCRMVLLMERAIEKKAEYGVLKQVSEFPHGEVKRIQEI